MTGVLTPHARRSGACTEAKFDARRLGPPVPFPAPIACANFGELYAASLAAALAVPLFLYRMHVFTKYRVVRTVARSVAVGGPLTVESSTVAPRTVEADAAAAARVS